MSVWGTVTHWIVFKWGNKYVKGRIWIDIEEKF